MKIYKAAALNIALYAFISLNPYIRWMLPNELFYGFFILSTLILTALISNSSRRGTLSNLSRIRVAFLLIVFIAYFTTPIVHEFRWGHLLWHLPLLFIIFYSDELIAEGYHYLKKIMVWIAIFSLILLFLKIIQFPLPYFSYTPDFRYNPLDYYRIYGPTISLYRGSFAVGEFYGLERITGVFAEPGHFGIYLGLILAIEKFNFSIRKNQILLTAGIFTFSTAFYGIFILGFIYRVFKDKRVSASITYPVLIILIISSIGLLGSVEGFKELTVGRAFSNLEKRTYNPSDIIDSRVSDRFIIDFEAFAQSPKLLTGFGLIDEGGYHTTNWRGMIIRFGVIGLIITLLLIISVSWNKSLLYMSLLILITLIVLAHRSYLLYTPAIYTLLLIATTLHRYSYNNINIKNK